ncbi:hypothetical protein E0H73_34595 [Kribbella pittospori]|uniref:DUF8094 domain-containing protein n=1 Tax=Kribbella pittospori TaxID=722689 RepID=A0A4R0K6U6_9ACTN|nr:hypothetical protein [Kribbella pittospori]TCC55861.1 hypothetical protein E0H73_34595 [Kribbella pittospori]
MRFARTALGLLLTLIGLVVTLAGAAAAFWLVGPDNTISTGSQPLTSKGLAVITAPDLLDRHGPTLHVTATGDKPVFVGVGQDLDVSNYLAGAAHTRVIRYDVPSTFSTQQMRGGIPRLTPPGELDWWVAKSGGNGPRSIAWPIEDGKFDVVVMNADGSPAVDTDVRFGVEVHRGFGICLLVLGTGIVLFALGLTLAFRRRPATVVPAFTPARIASVPAPARSVPVSSAPAAATPAASAPAVAEPVSPFAPERVSPFAPVPTDPRAYRAPADEPITEEIPVCLPAVTYPTPQPKPAKQPIPAAPMLMSPAAVARAKSPALLTPVGAGAPAYDDHVQTYDDPVVEPETVSLVESPEFEKSDEAVRKTAALLASGALLLTTTSCGLLPAKNSIVASDIRPAVTLADAQAVVAKYNQLNNRANANRDAKLSETIEADPTLAQTRAGFVISRKLDAAGKDSTKPFTYTDPQIGAPEFGSYPMRFVVSSGVSGAPDSRQLGVWQRQSAGTPWLLTNSVYPSAAMKLPPMEGLRTPQKADLDKLYSLPTSAATNLAAYLSGGAKSAQAKYFVPSPGSAKLLEQRAKAKIADTKESYIASVSDTFTPSGEPLTFITSSGEALVFLALTEQYLQRVEPGSNAYWTSGEATAFSSMVKYTQTLHQDYLHQVALVIPTKASGGTIRIISMDGQLVGAGGS